MGKDLDGAKKNRAVVMQEFENLKAELDTLPPRIKQAVKDKDVYEVLHIATNYIGEPIEQLPRFWLYVWPVKYAAISWMVYTLAANGLLPWQ